MLGIMNIKYDDELTMVIFLHHRFNIIQRSFSTYHVCNIDTDRYFIFL